MLRSLCFILALAAFIEHAKISPQHIDARAPRQFAALLARRQLHQLRRGVGAPR